MSEMIKRVARAMAKSHGELGASPELDAKYTHYYLEHARAAIASMREPTEAMIDAAFASSANEDCGETICGKPTIQRLHQAMIDKALED